MIDLSPRQFATVKSILAEHVPECEIRAYGSRATWTARDYSDVDLAVVGKGPLAREVIADLKEAFQDSDLPMRVDVLDWHGVSEEFREAIEAEMVVLPVCGGGGRTWSTLTNLAKITMGQSPPGKTVNRERTGTPLLNGPSEFGPHHPEPVQYTTDVRRLAHADDILFCVRGATTGRMNWADRKYAIGRGIAAIRHREDPSLQPFIRAVIEFGLAELLALATGSTFPNVSKQQLGSVQCPSFDESEQHAIAHVLGTLDDRIELNRRMNETLEAMARALFKSWFVDFDPVRAKMEGRETGLPAHLADLFPDRLVDSEMGEIPEGWRYGTLNDLARLNPESWSSRNAPDRIRYVDLANTKWGSINDIQEFTWEAAPSRGRRILRRGDTIVGTVRPRNGSFALIDRDGLTGSTAFAVLRPDTPTERELVWCTATSEGAIERLAHLADGGAYPAVRPKAVLDTAVALPSAPVRLAFSSLAAPLANRMGATQRESRTLAALRDTLLPKLISGEIRVPDAKRIVASVT